LQRPYPAAWPHGILKAAILLLLLALAACQSTLAPKGGEAASAAAMGQLTSIRQAHGLQPLKLDRELEQAAIRQAGYMAASGRMAHRTGIGRGFRSRMSNTRTNGAAAENIAHGAMGIDRLFDMWMNSAGHRRNMLDPRFSRFGLARSGEGRDRYWALVLGR
jgi:uncharacterized protein YkwD